MNKILFIIIYTSISGLLLNKITLKNLISLIKIIN